MLVRYVSPVNKKPAKIRNINREFAKQLNSRSIYFHVHKKEYAKIEKQNNISINVSGYTDETPYHIHALKQTFEKYVNLSLLSNPKNYHHVLIKDFNKFMTNKTKHHGKKHFCQYCLQCFSSSKLLKCHIKDCLAITHARSVLLSEEAT